MQDIPIGWIFVGAIFLAIILPVFMLIFLRGRHGAKLQALSFERQSLHSPTAAFHNTAMVPRPAASKDEAKIIAKIRAAGGSISQKKLLRTIRMPKAKARKLLSLLEARGTLRTARKGRETLVSLA